MDFKNIREQLQGMLLPMLRCVECRGCLQLDQQSSVSFGLAMDLNDEHLVCAGCSARYPVTQDLIPIIWSAPLRRYLTSHEEGVSTIGANIQIYDATSDDYQAHTRQNPAIAQRIQAAAQRLVGASDKARTLHHLDFGCGPGHVLGWLKPYKFLQVGLDVSLRNLRNTRKNTGAAVVCGDATNMPFADNLFDLVTESSVLHHIEDWKTAIEESCRVCREQGGVLLDSEPSHDQMDWSRLAVAVFNSRFLVYKWASLVWAQKYVFRDRKRARLNLAAEVHHQPGTGFPLEELKATFRQRGFDVEIVLSPDEKLRSVARPNLQSIILNLLSGRNPRNPKYGAFLAMARHTREGLLENYFGT